jgi:NADH dehydrogenase
MGKILAESVGAAPDRIGRIIVEADCSLKDHPEIFVIGDLAHYAHQGDKPLPGVAPVAKQQGTYVGRLIKARLQGKTLPPFRYLDLGSMATIGRGAAVADLHYIRFSGYPGWLAWLFIHLMSLVEYQSRFLVFVQWAWQYWTRNRSARLVTGAAPFPLVNQPLSDAGD